MEMLQMVIIMMKMKVSVQISSTISLNNFQLSQLKLSYHADPNDTGRQPTYNNNNNNQNHGQTETVAGGM